MRYRVLKNNGTRFLKEARIDIIAKDNEEAQDIIEAIGYCVIHIEEGFIEVRA